MARFNTSTVNTQPRSVRGRTPTRAASATPDTRTHEGGLAHAYEPMTELFMLLTASFVNENSYYEKGNDRVERARRLIVSITEGDTSENKAASGEWFMRFTEWLRRSAFIRSGAIVLACEAVKARLAVNAPGFNRDIVNFACDRGDEPGELLGYWLANYGKTVPISVKRGLADAVVRLYSEYSTLRYDTGSHAIRFGDVVNIAQPRTNARAAAGTPNHTLYRHLIDRRHVYNESPIPEGLTTLRARAELEALPVSERRAVLGQPDRLKAAALSWEALAGWLQGPMDAQAWEAIAPTMGFMAVLRNLRNFDEAGISKAAAAKVAARIADPAQVAKSRQLPFRFWSAYREISNDRWKVALGDALDASVQNIPDGLAGRTLVLVDTSASMGNSVSERSSVRMVEIAGLFGVAMAYKFGVESVDFCAFASSSKRYSLTRGASVLREVDAFTKRIGEVGHGTQIEDAVRAQYNGQDRVVLFSDMQTFGGYYGGQSGSIVPAHVPFFAFNLAGHGSTVVGNTPNRFQLGGLNDKTFGYMEQVERGVQSGWPWEVEGR